MKRKLVLERLKSDTYLLLVYLMASGKNVPTDAMFRNQYTITYRFDEFFDGVKFVLRIRPFAVQPASPAKIINIFDILTDKNELYTSAAHVQSMHIVKLCISNIKRWKYFVAHDSFGHCLECLY